MGNLMSKDDKEEKEPSTWGVNQKEKDTTQWASRGEILGNVATRKYDHTDKKPPKQYSRNQTADKRQRKVEERRTRSTSRIEDPGEASRSGTLERRNRRETGPAERRTRSTSRTGDPWSGFTTRTVDHRTVSRSGTLERRAGGTDGTGERRTRSKSRTTEPRTRSTSRNGDTITRTTRRTRGRSTNGSSSETLEHRSGSRSRTLERRSGSTSRTSERVTGSKPGTLERGTESKSGTLERHSGSTSGTLERGTGSTSGTGSVRSASNVSGSGPIYPWKQEVSSDTKIDCRGRRIKSQTVVADIEHQETSQKVYKLGHPRWRSDESEEGTTTNSERYESKSVYSASDKQMTKDSTASKKPESRRHQLYFGQQEYYVGY